MSFKSCWLLSLSNKTHWLSSAQDLHSDYFFLLVRINLLLLFNSLATAIGKRAQPQFLWYQLALVHLALFCKRKSPVTAVGPQSSNLRWPHGSAAWFLPWWAVLVLVEAKALCCYSCSQSSLPTALSTPPFPPCSRSNINCYLLLWKPGRSLQQQLWLPPLYGGGRWNRRKLISDLILLLLGAMRPADDTVCCCLIACLSHLTELKKETGVWQHAVITLH